MRVIAVLVAVASPIFVFASVPHGHPGPSAQTSSAVSGLILQASEGEHRVRRPRPIGAGQVATSRLTIKVDKSNGGSPNFFMATEEIRPGDAIAAHLHPEYDEILFVHRGSGLATLGSREQRVAEGATIYIPPNTRVSLKNTGNEPLSLVFIFPRPEMVSAYYRELSVPDGQPAVAFSPEEFAAFRARHKGHVVFDEGR